MKKQIFYLASAVLAAGLTACSSDELDGVNGVKLASNQLLATTPQSTSTRVGISEGANNKYKLSWVAGDSFSVFDQDTPTDNAEYVYSAATGEEESTGVFTAASKTVENPLFAYYPYADDGRKIAFGGTMEVQLPGTFDWKEGEVKAPMFGLVDGDAQTVTFKSLTALLKVSVVNMPADIEKVTLTSNAADNAQPLYGTATVKGIATDNTNEVKLGLKEGANTGNNTITYKFSATEGGEDMTFYFVIPADGTTDYTELVFSLGTFTYGDDTAEDNTIFASKLSKPAVGKVYEKAIRYTDGGTIEDASVVDVNDDLADVKEGGEVTGELSDLTTNPTILIPVAETQLNAITLTLSDIEAVSDSEDPTVVTIKEAEGTGKAPKSIVIKGNAATTNNNGVSLVIDLPNSTVELLPAGEEEPAVEYTQVTSSTSANTLKVGASTTIKNLIIVKGNVLVEDEGTVTKASKDASNTAKTYIFFEKTTPDDADKAYTDITPAPMAIYNLLTGAAAAEASAIVLPEDFTVEEADIEFAATTYLDLNGHTLTVADNGSITVVSNGSLTIIDGPVSSSTAEAVAGTLTSKDNTVTINVAGGTLEVKDGVTVSNTKANGAAISATDGTVKLTSAVVAGDINLNEGASKELAATVTAASVTGNINATNGAELTLNGATSEIIGDVSLDASTGTITSVKSITGAVSVANGSTATLTAGDIVGNVTVTGAESTLEISGGTIKPAKGVAITATNGGTVTVKEDAKSTAIESTDEEAISITAGGTVKVGAGSVTGSTAAVKVVKGTLEVFDEADSETNAPAFEGAKTILVLNAAKDDATVKLNAANATYKTTEEEGFAVYNHDEDSALATTKITISGGWFSGDVITDARKYFITGGGFKDCYNLIDNMSTYINLAYNFGNTSKNGFLTVTAKPESTGSGLKRK